MGPIVPSSWPGLPNAKKKNKNILRSGSNNSFLGWLQLSIQSLSEFSWLLKRARKIKKRKGSKIYTTYNTII